jgi:DNA-binding transcriptional regulator YhcF (GntR family)
MPNCPNNKDIFFWEDDKNKIASVNEEIIEEEKKEFIESFQKFHSSSKDIYELLLKIGEANNINPEVLDLIKQNKDKKVQ